MYKLHAVDARIAENIQGAGVWARKVRALELGGSTDEVIKHDAVEGFAEFGDGRAVKIPCLSKHLISKTFKFRACSWFHCVRLKKRRYDLH